MVDHHYESLKRELQQFTWSMTPRLSEEGIRVEEGQGHDDKEEDGDDDVTDAGQGC